MVGDLGLLLKTDSARGPRNMSQSPVSRNSNVERRMDRPKSVVGVERREEFLLKTESGYLRDAEVT